MVLYKNKYEVTMADSSAVPKEVNEALSGMKNYARQKPNTKVLGMDPIRLKLWIYTMSNPKKDNWWNRWLRKKGQAPVVYSENAALQTTQQLEQLLEGKGCFGSEVTFDTLKTKKRNITIEYHVKATPRYYIDDVRSYAETPEVNALLEKWKGGSYVKQGAHYDKEMLTKERTRIAENLQNEGYYKASKELVRFIVDTTDYGNRGLSVTTYVSNPPDGNGGTTPLQQYRTDNIYIYPQAMPEGAQADTTVFPYKSRMYMTNYTYLHSDKMTVKPKVISHSVTLFHKQLYRPRNTQNTYSALQSLRTFKYIDIKYAESPTSCDSNRTVDATIRLLTSDRRRLSASLELTNASALGTTAEKNFFTSGNFGIEGKLGYQNKNLFGGAELFKAEGSVLFEFPKLVLKGGLGRFHDAFSAFEAGLNLSLDVPDFLLPFTKNIVWQRMRPHTLFALGGSYQYRQYYERVLANASFGYSWRHSRTAQNQLLPIELTFVRFLNLDPTLMSRLSGISDLRLKYQYSDHFIMDARYDYTYSDQNFGTRQNFNFVHLSVETAGNLLQGLSLACNGPKDENGIRQIWGVPYSQYARASLDYKYYAYMGRKSTFVLRMMVGAGIPYANSKALPYEKGFFGGGPTTMRAWQLRRLGPGCYNGADQVLERMGDISMVLNLEQRFPIAWIFEGAVFADIGNVWLFNKSEEFPEGEFRFDNMFKSMAVGVGLGLRANISILTIRADFGIPLYDPGHVESLRWRPPHWKWNQIVTNIGIDYPF